MSIKRYYKPSLLLNPEHEKPLKQLALDRGVQVQDLIRDAVLGLLSTHSAYPVPSNTRPVLVGDTTTRAEGLGSANPSQLRKLSSLLEEAARLLDEVLTDGKVDSDCAEKMQSSLDAIDRIGEGAGARRGDAPEARLIPTKARRGR